MVQQVSDSELELMRIIWAKGGRVLYAQIMDDLMAAGSRWQKNTVITLLSRLVEKGLLKTNKIGRRNEYAALITEADYQALQAEKLIEKFYEGNAKGLVSTLIQRDMLTSEDYEELRKFWEEGNRGR
ncbi:BlaI/MecI/CopY family transcriptional regulator [Enterocloster aldenensis]|uniref:BlaI/MecI/CopY family transcriptional regulator n=1 Tax=Enterocloster aldenensis TaxID=358742 RepID=UPI000E47EE07|nr:BlaI/MecI/CopY family transcriptional regulator [Enterocloster aldenensis]